MKRLLFLILLCGASPSFAQTATPSAGPSPVPLTAMPRPQAQTAPSQSVSPPASPAVRPTASPYVIRPAAPAVTARTPAASARQVPARISARRTDIGPATRPAATASELQNRFNSRKDLVIDRTARRIVEMEQELRCLRAAYTTEALNACHAAKPLSAARRAVSTRPDTRR